MREGCKLRLSLGDEQRELAARSDEWDAKKFCFEKTNSVETKLVVKTLGEEGCFWEVGYIQGSAINETRYLKTSGDEGVCSETNWIDYEISTKPVDMPSMF